MNIEINRESQTPIYKQIENGITALIRNEEIVCGYKLPSERELAKHLNVHRNTVVKSYEELVAKGYVVSSRSAPRGYFVLASQKDDGKNYSFSLAKMIRYNFSANEKVFAQIFDESNSDRYISLGGIVMDSNFSPITRMSDILEKMKGEKWSSNINKLNNNETDRLKTNICEMLKKRNMYINNKNVQIVSETTQAIGYIAELYLQEGDYVIVEEPTIPDTVNVFRNKGINIASVSLEEDGLNLKELELLIVEKAPKFVYVMPNYHNPTSTVMSLKKRIKLLEITQKYGTPIIEDDSLRDFSYSDKNIPSLYSLDCHNSVLYIDTFTLTFLPGIKTAYIVGPYEPIEMIGEYIIMGQVFISNIGQYMLNEFIECGQYQIYISDMKEYYKRKRDVLVTELKKLEDKGVSFNSPEGGLFIWCSLKDGINVRKLYLTCKELGLLIMPGYIFYPDGYHGNGHIRLCFSNVTDIQIKEAVKLLAEAIDISFKGSGEG